MIDMDLNNPICPSCGFPKQDSTGKDMSHAIVCFYCYHRGSPGNLKMFILYILNELDKPVTIYELADIMTNHTALKERSTFNRNRIKRALENMTRPKNNLILKAKKKNRSNNGAGRKVNIYRIGKRKGVKYLEKYLERSVELSVGRRFAALYLLAKT
jgi:DNA-binding PadR family transcriptional regulator